MRRTLDERRGEARWLWVVAVVVGLGWPVLAGAQTIETFAVPTPTSEPVGIALGPDKATWFTEAAANKIGKITVAGVVTEFLVPTGGSEPFGIAVGPDGNLWFAEALGNKIGRITTAGAVTEFPIPTAGAEPIGITAGPDGNLWFTEGMSNKIGQITTAGAITEFPVPTAGSGPFFITAGPDGALWFTENTTGKIGRITTGGGITEFLTSSPTSMPFGIATGSDGALWFTEGTGNNIGRLTTTGSLLEFPIPTATSDPVGIAAGPDGALWFAEDTGAKIGRITTSGTIQEFPVAAGSQPALIALGPNNALWFTELVGNAIGTFETALLTVTTSGAGSGIVTSNVPVGGTRIDCGASHTKCTLTYMTGTAVPITLTASASTGSNFSDWSGGGCTGKAPCALALTANTTVDAKFALKGFMLSIAPTGNGSGTVTSSPSGINCGTTCSASFAGGTQVTLTAVAASNSTFAGWSGGGCVGIEPCVVTVAANTTVTPNFVQNTTPDATLAAAVLPLSRSVEVGGTPATAFATIINAGPGNASICSIAPTAPVPASFTFQTTNPATNALTGTLNTPVNIAAGQSQSFVIAFTPTAAFGPATIDFTFGCSNATPAPPIVGVNTLDLSASTTPVPDIVALAATSDPGYVDIPGATGMGLFAVATVNLGADGTITAAADSGTANLPVTVTVCQTNPATGVCMAAAAATVTTDIPPNATPTFGIFVTGSAAIADMPGVNRIFVTFTDAGGVLRGETSVAVRTQ
jgi:streptogramin lyase